MHGSMEYFVVDVMSTVQTALSRHETENAANAMRTSREGRDLCLR